MHPNDKKQLESQRAMVVDYFKKTGSRYDIEAAFHQFVAPELRRMLYGGTPGHDIAGNRLDGEA